MGASQSDDGLTNHGYRVLSLDKNSPLEKAGIKPMVDFICYEPVSKDDPGIYSQAISLQSKFMELEIYNLVSQAKRYVTVTPNNKWGGSSLLGATVRFENYSNAHKTVYYVSDVEKGSPAQKAGLHPTCDYIVGSKDVVFTQLDDIGVFAEKCIDKAIHLAVYSTMTHDIRETFIVPTKAWNGLGLLGCELSMGEEFSIPLKRPKSSKGGRTSIFSFVNNLMPSKSAKKSRKDGRKSETRKDYFAIELKHRGQDKAAIDNSEEDKQIGGGKGNPFDISLDCDSKGNVYEDKSTDMDIMNGDNSCMDFLPGEAQSIHNEERRNKRKNLKRPNTVAGGKATTFNYKDICRI